MSKSIDEQRRQLPAYQARAHLSHAFKNNNTMILMGETGSGKTTQTPQLLLDIGFAQKGLIGITQPRRISAITLAKRVSREQNCQLGELVGYSVRFEDCTSEKTKIKFLTDGMLLRESLSDKILKKYSVIVLDEAHERTINTDVLFGVVKRAQRERKEYDDDPLKIVIMSATMDVDHFSKYFNKCPVFFLPGRTFPVKIMHAKQYQSDYQFAALVTLFEIHKSAPANHDVLIFLTGQEEIEQMAHQIRTIAKSPDLGGGPQIRVFPLYAALPQPRQLEVFQTLPAGQRKVILATNIAETSITINGIRYVIDTGVVKMRNHDPVTGMDTLKVSKISQAQAIQRTGRAGRECEGTCYRTYQRSEYNNWPIATKPEIQRCNLSTAVLQLMSMDLDVTQFDFMDAPSPEAVKSALNELALLGACKLFVKPIFTEFGRRMAKFPLDPRFSKIIMTAPSYECLSEILDLVAILSVENIFIECTDKRDAALTAHARFHSKYGDHLTLLNVFREYLRTEKNNMWCRENFLNGRNLSYAKDIRKQLEEICHRINIPCSNSGSATSEQVRKCLISGLFNNIAELQQRDNSYLTLATRQLAHIHPSSVLSGYNGNISNGSNGIINAMPGSSKSMGHSSKSHNRPRYVLFTELVSTNRLYLRCVSKIEPDWIEEVVPECSFLNQISSNCYYN